MTHDDKLSKEEAKIYGSTITNFFNTQVDADDAHKLFKNPAIGANLKAAAAFLEAALTLMEYENDSRRSENGNNQNSGNFAATVTQ